ncbi:MAG: sulfite exporter TauE/SafE family protein [Bacteroidetes bacterium]|nr:sulfite exporter TauE/SafE family protein [Bacteroidota bacterium]
MEILGYLLAILIGVSLGLIGGGGSILTVPILVYVLGVNAELSTSYSLFIVGSTSLVGAIFAWRQGLLDIRTGLVFGIPSILAVYATRQWIMPHIPQVMLHLGDFELTKRLFLLGLFAILMILASWSMLRKPRAKAETKESSGGFNYPMILAEGAVVGVITGLVGAGGGFLIIPALVLFTGLPMKQAVGTSLMIIAAKSLIGFTGDLGKMAIDWQLLLIFTAFSIGGIFIGQQLAKRIPGEKLKPAFGWFVLAMGIYIILKETVFHG